MKDTTDELMSVLWITLKLELKAQLKDGFTTELVRLSNSKMIEEALKKVEGVYTDVFDTAWKNTIEKKQSVFWGESFKQKMDDESNKIRNEIFKEFREIIYGIYLNE